jgi:molecular chaperone DnaJ
MKTLVENYYDILGVAHTASTDEIKVAESALLKIYEARSKKGDAQATHILQRLNEADATLTDPARRAAYDRKASAIAAGFSDVAYSPQIDKYEKVRAVTEWFEGGDPVRAATLLDGKLPEDLLVYDRLLDEGN